MKGWQLFTEASKNAGVARYWEHGNYPDDYYETVKRYATTSMKSHLAMNKNVDFEIEASPKYPVGGGSALTDGLKGINDYHFNWLGFEGPDMVAVIDFEEVKKIHSVEAGFLQEIKSWVFLPEQLELSFSNDGKEFYSLLKPSKIKSLRKKMELLLNLLMLNLIR